MPRTLRANQARHPCTAASNGEVFRCTTAVYSKTEKEQPNPPRWLLLLLAVKICEAPTLTSIDGIGLLFQYGGFRINYGLQPLKSPLRRRWLSCAWSFKGFYGILSDRAPLLGTAGSSGCSGVVDLPRTTPAPTLRRTLHGVGWIIDNFVIVEVAGVGNEGVIYGLLTMGGGVTWLLRSHKP
jgi:hypothetical protein